MNAGKKEALNTVGSAGAGAVAGVGIYSLTGGIGIAVGGTAVGLTVGPFIVIGAGVGATAYGIYWLGKQVANAAHKN